MDNRIRINLTIGGKKYAFKVDRKDEEVYRKAAKEVDQKYTQYLQRQLFDPKDCLTMIALESYVTQKIRERDGEDKEMNRKLSEIYDTLAGFDIK